MASINSVNGKPFPPASILVPLAPDSPGASNSQIVISYAESTLRAIGKVLSIRLGPSQRKLVIARLPR